MTETIQQLKEDIAILQMKLRKLEEQESKMILKGWGDCDMVSYDHKDYYRLSFGGSSSYWYKRYIGNCNLMRVEDPEEHNLVEGIYNDVILDTGGVVEEEKDWSYKIADNHGGTNPYKQFLNSVEDEKKMAELGFVKNSDGNWTAQPLVETAQERGEGIHKEFEEFLNKHNPQEKKVHPKFYEVVKELQEKEEYPYKKYTPEETEQSLRKAFVEVQKTEKWKEIEKLIDEKDNDKNFKNSLELIKKWGEKNKPPTLKELLWEWWENVFTANSNLDADASIDALVDIIDKKFIPPSRDSNSYDWEKCLKMMRETLR